MANVLLRHAWFFVFPFSPSLILTAHLSGYSVNAIIARQWYLTVLAMVVVVLWALNPLTLRLSEGQLPGEEKLHHGRVLRRLAGVAVVE